MKLFSFLIVAVSMAGLKASTTDFAVTTASTVTTAPTVTTRSTVTTALTVTNLMAGTAEAAQAIAQAPSQPARASGRAVGPVLARVRIDVFSDFQCPSCKALAEGALKRVRDEYALKGKIRLVHHDFPLPQHQYARRAAALAAAADRLGKFEQVSDVLFRQQDSWSATGKVDEAVDSVLTPEERKRIREIANDPAIAAAIDRDLELGRKMKVSSTPTMIVTKDGKTNPVVGSVTYSIFSRYLDTLLAP